MPELIKTASEAEWLEARRTRVTASEIAVLLGLSPYDSPYGLYHRKLGILPGQPDNPMMERGRVLEPYIADKFGERHPEYIVDGTGRELYVHSERPWQGATPDRLLQDAATCGITDRGGVFEVENTAVLECKCDGGSPEWGEEGTDQIPVHYRAQVIWQMDVMGVHTAYVACLDPARWTLREYVIGHEPTYAGSEWGCNGDTCQVCDDLAVMLGAAREFLDRIERREPPEVDWRPQTTAALRALSPMDDSEAEVSGELASAYELAVATYKQAEQEKKLRENQLRQAMGTARRAVVAGRPVARRDVYDVKESVRKGYQVDKLVPTPPKPEKES